jgi:hypothetical protein
MGILGQSNLSPLESAVGSARKLEYQHLLRNLQSGYGSKNSSHVEDTKVLACTLEHAGQIQ